VLHRRAVFISLVSLTLAAGIARAQNPKTPKPNPVMRGAVQDTLGRGLEGAQVEILGLKLVTTTPSSGSFRFDNIRPGKYWVAVRRIGYAPLRTALTFNPGDDRDIVFELEPLAQVLPEIKVRAEDQRWMRRYQDFVWRSHSAFGHFLTRDDLDKSHAAYLGDVVRRYLPFTTSDVFFNSTWSDPFSATSRMRQFGSSSHGMLGRNCPPAVSVNGARPMGGWAVNDFRPESVEAVEVYRGGWEMPAEFVGWDLPCGLVVVWTR